MILLTLFPQTMHNGTDQGTNEVYVIYRTDDLIIVCVTDNRQDADNYLNSMVEKEHRHHFKIERHPIWNPTKRTNQ